MHLICDGQGTPLAVAVGPGQEHETQQAIPLLEQATAWPEQPAKVAGDKGYSAGWLREWLRERGIEVAYRRGALRLAPHLYNTGDDIDRALAVLHAG